VKACILRATGNRLGSGGGASSYSILHGSTPVRGAAYEMALIMEVADRTSVPLEENPS
jgi:hypothetical protein